jgi:hypothetical protein
MYGFVVLITDATRTMFLGFTPVAAPAELKEPTVLETVTAKPSAVVTAKALLLKRSAIYYSLVLTFFDMDFLFICRMGMHGNLLSTLGLSMAFPREF